MTAFDSIDGGEGTGDTLNVTNVATGATSWNSTAVGSLTVKNMENVNVTSIAGITVDTTGWGTTALSAQNTAAGNIDVTAESTTAVTATNSFSTGTVTVAGGLSQTISGVAGDVTASGSKGAITVTQTKAAATDVLVNGGTTVTITQTGKTAVGSNVTVGNISAPTGAVTVTTSSDSTAATFTTGAISVKGGSSVAITSNLLGTAATATITSGTIGVTGTADTTTVSVTQTKAATAAAGVTGVVNGAVTIADVNAGTSTADKITTVTLANYGNSTIDSAALNSLTISGGGGTLGVNRTTSDTTANATTLALNVGGGSFGAITGTHLVDFTTVNLATSGAATTLANLQATAATKVNISGDKNLTTTAHGFAAAAVITSTSSADVTLGTALAVGQQYVGGAGVDTLTLAGAQTKANSSGAGDDVITYGGAFGTGGSFDAGAGNDTLKMTAAQAVTATGSTTFAGTVSNFEVLEFTATTGAAAAINMANADGINSLVLVGVDTGALTVTNAAAGFTVTHKGAGVDFASSIALADATGTNDTVNLVYTANDGFADTASTTIAGVENLRITTKDLNATAQTTQFTANVTATSLKSVTISGDTGVVFTNTDTTITSLDATGLTSTVVAAGGLTWTTGALAAAATIKGTALAATNTVDFSAATGGAVTYTGGSGIDTITGSNGKNNVVSLGGGDNSYTSTGVAGNNTVTADDGDNTIVVDGTGNNTVTLGSGANTVTLGSGQNTLTITTDTDDADNITVAAPTSANTYSTITGLAKNDVLTFANKGTEIWLDTTDATPITGGTATKAQIQLNTATALFADYINAATVADGSTNGVFSWFQFGGNTFVVQDKSAGSSFVSGTDIIVKLTGLVDLSTATLSAAANTITLG